MLSKIKLQEVTTKMLEERRGNCAQAVFATYTPMFQEDAFKNCKKCVNDGAQLSEKHVEMEDNTL
jgi:hypothetical protein